MSSLKPCDNLNVLANSKIAELENYGQQLRNQVELYRDLLKDYTTPASLLEDVNDAIEGATINDLGAGSEALSQLTNFTGACLDQIIDDARNFVDNIQGFVADTINDITSFVSLPEIDLLEPLRALTSKIGSIVGGLGIDSLINEIDKLLGCLAEGSGISECLETVDSFNERIDNVIKYLGLNDDGTFDIDTFISEFNINIDTSVIDNLKNLDDKVTDLVTNASANIKNHIPKTVNPSSRF